MQPFRILHLGLGSFHRAHQAVYLQRLQDAGNATWSLASGNIRPELAHFVAQLQAQGGSYTLETIAADGSPRYDRVESIREVVPWDERLSGFVKLARDPATRIISFTVTEAGYSLAAGGELDTQAPEIRADLAAARQGQPGTTLYGALALMLRERLQAGAGPVTLLSCDNLRHNGDKSRAGLLTFLELLGDAALLQWVRENTSSPNAMVDRITPRPTQEIVGRVQAATGRHDPCALMAESYLQWVIEDNFIAGRPAWERVGVEMVRSVDPYEEAKIRLLNAAHSCVAWGGTLAGHAFIHEGVADARVRAAALAYATDDVIPVLTP
ncbi:MAG TPA: mannitol dehydrogenase family protein, partial [Ramlibacter sp.]|nr:mannitol dehydrogenase family protein [Ramlibacter sp.]